MIAGFTETLDNATTFADHVRFNDHPPSVWLIN